MSSSAASTLGLSLAAAGVPAAGFDTHLLLDILLVVLLLLVILRYRMRVAELRAAERALRQSELRVRAALSATSDGYWEWDLIGQRILRSALDDNGQLVEREYRLDEFRQAVHPDDLARFDAALGSLLTAASDSLDVEFRMRSSRFPWRWVVARGAVSARDAGGQAQRLAGTFRDITDTREAQRLSRVAEAVIERMQEAVAVTDAHFNFVTVNPGFERMTGFASEDIIGQSTALLNSDRHDPEHYRQVRAELSEHGRWQGELWQRRKDGVELLLELKITRIKIEPDGEELYVSVIDDITERRRNENRLQRLASHDPLTGLLNRGAFLQQLDSLLLRAEGKIDCVAVLEIDLDRLKAVNESYGHDVGDELLHAVSQRLAACSAAGDLIARLSSDEFALVPRDARTQDEALWQAKFLLNAFAEPFQLGSRSIRVTPSIGISFWPEHGLDARHLINAADSAMYDAKAQGRNTLRVYAPERDRRLRERLALERGVRQAVERGEFVLLYQPRYSTSSQTVTGFEALLRWKHPERGLVGPDEFVSILEDTGLIVQVGRWVLSEALSQVRDWRQHGHENVAVSVNVSQRQLADGTLHRFLAILLNEIGLRGDALELEITESELLQEPEVSVRVLEDLHKLGVQVAIDDFGTGYSSLGQLRRLPIDILKIDKAFVGDLPAAADSGVIIETIIGMARTLKMRVVAEGVENEAQARFLMNLGVDEIQGYWYARPMPAANCLPLLQGQDARKLGLRPVG